MSYKLDDLFFVFWVSFLVLGLGLAAGWAQNFLKSPKIALDIRLSIYYFQSVFRHVLNLKTVKAKVLMCFSFWVYGNFSSGLFLLRWSQACFFLVADHFRHCKKMEQRVKAITPINIENQRCTLKVAMLQLQTAIWCSLFMKAQVSLYSLCRIYLKSTSKYLSNKWSKNDVNWLWLFQFA